MYPPFANKCNKRINTGLFNKAWHGIAKKVNNHMFVNKDWLNYDAYTHMWL